LIHRLTNPQDIATQVKGIVPTVRVVGDLKAVRQDEFDLFLTGINPTVFHPHLFGIAVAPAVVGSAWRQEGSKYRRVQLDFLGVSVATEFIIPDELPPNLHALVERVLLPLAQSRESNRYLRTSLTTLHEWEEVSEPALSMTPLLNTVEPKTIAAIIRLQGPAERWILPEGITDLVPWLKAALGAWTRVAPDRFPFDPSWIEDRRWATFEEHRILEGIDELARERTRSDQDFDLREANLRARLHSARLAADEGERLLLAGTGEQLVKSVESTLRHLGFEVSNRDEINPPTDRLEDLRVTSPEDDPDWIALVEVRSYNKGAQQGDLLRLVSRFAGRFRQDAGRDPTRLWYLVNQFVGQDPASRPPPLHSSPRDIQAFAEQGGLVASTTSLFEVLKRVRTGAISAADVRADLMQSVGPWPRLEANKQ